MDRRTSFRWLSVLALVTAVFALAMPGSVTADEPDDADFLPGAIVGRVFDEKGEPVAGAFVRLVYASPRGLLVVARTETDRRGGFEFPRVRPGQYGVQAAKRGVGEGAARVAVREGQTVRVRIELSAP